MCRRGCVAWLHALSLGTGRVPSGARLQQHAPGRPPAYRNPHRRCRAARIPRQPGLGRLQGRDALPARHRRPRVWDHWATSWWDSVALRQEPSETSRRRRRDLGSTKWITGACNRAHAGRGRPRAPGSEARRGAGPWTLCTDGADVWVVRVGTCVAAGSGSGRHGPRRTGRDHAVDVEVQPQTRTVRASARWSRGLPRSFHTRLQPPARNLLEHDGAPDE